MAVQVQQPTRKKRDIFDVLLGGLQAASAFTNIQKGQAELEALPEAKARAARAEEIKIAQTFQPAEPGTKGAISLPGKEGLFVPRAAVAGLKKESANQESKLRDAWLKNKQTTTTQTVADATGKIVAAAATGKASAAGDMALIFSFMKLLDPGSTVREGEFATVENSRGWSDEARAQYNKAREGERLTPAQRGDFASQAKKFYNVHWNRQQQFNKSFEDLADRMGLQKQNVVLNLGLDASAYNKAIDDYVNSIVEDGPGLPFQGQSSSRLLPSPTTGPQGDFDIDEFIQGP